MRKVCESDGEGSGWACDYEERVEMTAEQHGIVLTLLLYKMEGSWGTMLEILKYIQSFSNETLIRF